MDGALANMDKSRHVKPEIRMRVTIQVRFGSFTEVFIHLLLRYMYALS